jgi:hypothetical protein
MKDIALTADHYVSATVSGPRKEHAFRLTGEPTRAWL